MEHSPAFGQADLTNCERELIHLAGSIQPHGVLLVQRERDGLLVQVSANSAAWLGAGPPDLLGRPLAMLGGDLETRVQQLAAAPDLADPRPLQVLTTLGGTERSWQAAVHRVAAQGVLVIELEADTAAAGLTPVAGPAGDPSPVAPALMQRLAESVQRFGQAASIGALCDDIAVCVRGLTGYDRVMVYKFDPDGHGKIIAEARDARLEPLLGHHYPASDIPQRARQLYLANRVRVLVDVQYQPVPLVPAQLPADPAGGQPDAADLDMSMCFLRSMSPLHLQYLKNMGVTGTLVVSLVRDGGLWGLIAAHHDTPRSVGPGVRAACDLLAEVAATRIAAIENYAHAQVAILVRRLEQRLVEATSTEGDWRLALFRNPRTLLQPLDATGAALFHDGEWLTTGEVPSTPELRQLLQWIDRQYVDPPFATSALGKADAALQPLAPMASGVLAVKLSSQRPDYLMWFRKEQLHTVTWAGDPAKPTVNDDPLTLSPRRSFAAWSEIVRGTSTPWSTAELALGRAIGASLVDIIVQVNAVRLLVAEHQLASVRATVQSSHEPVAIADGQGRLLFANPALAQLLGRAPDSLDTLDALAGAFDDPGQLQAGLDSVRRLHQAWRGELGLPRHGSAQPAVPVGLRIELVPGRDGQVLGYILVLSDLSDSQRAEAARRHLEDALQQAGRGGRIDVPGSPADQVISAILTNASLAAMDIADSSGAGVAPLLEEVEASARRAAVLYGRIRQHFS